MPIAAVVAAPRRHARLRPVEIARRRRASIDASCVRLGQEAQVRLQDARSAASRARSRAAARRAAPSFGRTRRCRNAAPVLRASAASAGGQLRAARSACTIALGQRRRRSRLGTISASCRSVSTSQQAVGVGRDDRLPHRQRLEHGQRRAFPQRREHHEVERRQRRGDVARKPANTNRSPRPSARACASSSRLQLAFADDEEARVGMRCDDRRRRLDQVLVALRRHQPRDRADGDRPRRDAERLRAPRRSRRALRGRANSSSGAPR